MDVGQQEQPLRHDQLGPARVCHAVASHALRRRGPRPIRRRRDHAPDNRRQLAAPRPRRVRRQSPLRAGGRRCARAPVRSSFFACDPAVLGQVRVCTGSGGMPTGPESTARTPSGGSAGATQRRVVPRARRDAAARLFYGSAGVRGRMPRRVGWRRSCASVSQWRRPRAVSSRTVGVSGRQGARVPGNRATLLFITESHPQRHAAVRTLGRSGRAGFRRLHRRCCPTG